MALKVAAVAGDRRFSAPERAPLGINTGTVNAPMKTKAKSGLAWKLQRIAQDALPGERVAKCYRTRRHESVYVLRHPESHSAHYYGLLTCGSVWHCPICAAKITEHRRAELQAAITAWVKRGGEVYLMTLTFPHERADDLAGVIAKQADALKRFKNSRAYKAVRAEIGHIGSIRALEVTWGAWHGWHPHTHDLIFARRGMLPVLQRLQGAWIDAVIAAGLAVRSQMNDMIEAAFDVCGGDYAAEYVAKYGMDPSLDSKLSTGETWGVARELTQGMHKGGATVRRLKGLTPFALLRRRYELRDMQAAALFCEFGTVFKGRRQLYWTPGLRDRLNLDSELSDAAVADALPSAPYEQVALLDKTQWRLIIAHEARGLLLDYAERHGAVGVAAVLSELRARPPTHDTGGTESDRYG